MRNKITVPKLVTEASAFFKHIDFYVAAMGRRDGQNEYISSVPEKNEVFPKNFKNRY